MTLILLNNKIFNKKINFYVSKNLNSSIGEV